MDTITHGILGAAVTQSLLMRRLPRGAAWIGAIGAMAPDLDIFIRSAIDPTVAWTFHRHFTHSLVFVPIGGLIVALPFLWMSRYRKHRKEVILASIISYATHGFLDSLTNYGTQQLWPFSNYRVAWDWIGIVDPIYSIMLIIGLYLAWRRKQPGPARAAFLLSTLYICFGGWQHHRAVQVQDQIAAMRGHQPQHSRVMPAPGWLIYWRSTYIADGRLYADGIRTPWFTPSLVLEGESAPAIRFEDLPSQAQANPESRRRFQILYWFADRLIAPIEEERNAIGDMRITASVEGLTPLWGLQFDPSSGAAERWVQPPTYKRHYVALIRGLFLGDKRYKELKSFRVTAKP